MGGSCKRPPFRFVQGVAAPMLRLCLAIALFAACNAVPAVESWMVADGFLADGSEGRGLADTAAKRKFCNITNLPGDYRYEVP